MQLYVVYRKKSNVLDIIIATGFLPSVIDIPNANGCGNGIWFCNNIRPFIGYLERTALQGKVVHCLLLTFLPIVPSLLSFRPTTVQSGSSPNSSVPSEKEPYRD
jgi:hypothetical protein